MWNKGKINTIRTVALALVFAGILVMYGSFFVQASWAVAFFMGLGLVMILASTAIYFWVGLLSTKAVLVTCPSCQKSTKVLGRIDECMHCKQALTLDRKLATDQPSQE